MNYRTTKLLAATDLGAGGTKTIDINVVAPISRIMLQWKVSKLQALMNNYCHKDISKIELVDGSDVLFSMDGGQAQALNIFDRKCGSMNFGQYINANDQFSYYGIDFGRFLFDPMLAFDPKKFNNPQLKVTYSEIVSDTAVVDSTLEVIAEVFDEKVVSPIGFLMSKAHHVYSVGDEDSYEYIKLPTDHPYRKLLIQGYSKAYEPWNVVKEARLNEDNEKRIPFDWELEIYHQHRKGIDTPVQEEVVLQPQGGGAAYYMTPTDYWATLVTQGQDAGDQAATGASGRGGYFLVTAGGSTQAQCICKGWLPNHCFHFPFGDEKDMDDWYDVSRIGSLELRLRAGADTGTGGVGAVILQQLRRY